MNKSEVFCVELSYWKKKIIPCYLQFSPKDCRFLTLEMFERKYYDFISQNTKNCDDQPKESSSETKPKIFADNKYAEGKTENFITVLYWASKIGIRKKLDNLLSSDANGICNRNFITVRVEDGFIRSNGLGSNFYDPYSLIFDNNGIYYDPSMTSDLELILSDLKNRADYCILRERAELLRKSINQNKITKYSQGIEIKEIRELKQFNKYNFIKIIFVPGQVDSDASLVCGGCDENNLSLLQKVRSSNPNAYIIYKIHPDIVANNRKQGISLFEIKKYSNLVVSNQYSSIDCISAADEIHTITSLSGFEALIRDKKVVCYGMPFYAGYGLTEDKAFVHKKKLALDAYERRKFIKIDLTDLVIGSLILYPVYYDWSKKQVSEPEKIIDLLLKNNKSRHHPMYLMVSKFFYPFRKLLLKFIGYN